MNDEYRVRVTRPGRPDKFYAKKDLSKADKMVREWEAERDQRFRHTLNRLATLTIETRQMPDWVEVTRTRVEGP